MIDIVHVTVPDALSTARIIIYALGADHELSIKWIVALRQFGYRWDNERDGFMRSV